MRDMGGTELHRCPPCLFGCAPSAPCFQYFVTARQVLTLVNVEDKATKCACRKDTHPSLLLQAHIFVVAIPCYPSFHAGANEAATQTCRQLSEPWHHRITNRKLFENDSHLHPAEDFWRRMNYLLAGRRWNRQAAPWQLWQDLQVSIEGSASKKCVWSNCYCLLFHSGLAVGAHTQRRKVGSLLSCCWQLRKTVPIHSAGIEALAGLEQTPVFVCILLHWLLFQSHPVFTQKTQADWQRHTQLCAFHAS